MAAKQSWFSRLFSRGKGRPEEASRTSWARGQVLLDDFEVEGELGEGGMGKVYLVRSRSGGQRFAVKRTKLRDEGSRRNFLAELQTWIDLPDHPHLAACRFFRTVGDEVAIFAEFVEGGSLAAWIHERKLTRLEQILDVAIQFAWGLHAAHEAGLVHQDVKPGNVLMTKDGVAKVADFGLARARAVVGETASGTGQSILVSVGGMTPAYCSPEQAEGRPLSRRSDIWSWGLSVLEMFQGEVTWQAGPAAAEVLEMYLKTGGDGRLPAMPASLAEVLRRCFCHDPSERWASLAEVAEVLKRVYRQSVGRDYVRPAPSVGGQVARAQIAHDRRIAGAQWTDPREWLVKALQAAGRPPAEADALLPPRTGSRKAQVIADLAAYEETRRIYEGLVGTGRKDLENDLASLCVEKAIVHNSADDHPGAVAMHDRAIEIRERLVHQEGRRGLASDLARTYHHKANVLRDLGDLRAAVALYDRAIETCERLVLKDGRLVIQEGPLVRQEGRLVLLYGPSELAIDQAAIYHNKANAVMLLGDLRAAVALYDRTIEIRERLIHQEGRRELAHELAGVYETKAAALRNLGDLPGAVAMHDRAIEIQERLVNQEGRRELAEDLAVTYQNKAVALHDLGDLRGAVAMHDRAIEIRERLVHQEGRHELANDLAATYHNKAAALYTLGDQHAAVALYGQAIGIRERLVHQEGRRELANDLAATYLNKAAALRALGDLRAAVALYDRVIEIRERLVHQEGRRELAHELALTYQNKANALSGMGDLRAAVPIYDRIIEIRKRLVHQEGRRELQGNLGTLAQ